MTPTIQTAVSMRALSPTLTESDVLDAQALARLRQLDPSGRGDLVHRVLATYVVSLSRLRQQMVHVQPEGDNAGLRMGAHTLKSSSASVGALDLSQLCAAVEASIRDERLEGLPELVAQMQCEMDRVDTAVRRMIAN